MPAESEKIQSGTYDIITVELTYDILIVEPHDRAPALTKEEAGLYSDKEPAHETKRRSS